MKKVTIYTMDYCPYCIRAKSLLEKKKINFTEINLHKEPDKFEEMQKKTNGARTLPQIFVNEKHVGDCDHIHLLDSEGKLETILKD